MQPGTRGPPVTLMVTRDDDHHRHYNLWGAQLAQFTAANNLIVLNDPRSPPTFQSHLAESWIDVSFASVPLASCGYSWSVADVETLSDHKFILFPFFGQLKLKTKRLTKSGTSALLQTLVNLPWFNMVQGATLRSPEAVDLVLAKFYAIFDRLCRAHSRWVRPRQQSANSWWTPELTVERKRVPSQMSDCYGSLTDFAHFDERVHDITDDEAYRYPSPYGHGLGIEVYNDAEFSWRYRCSKQAAVGNAATGGRTDSERGHPVPPLLQLLIALRFYGAGTFQRYKQGSGHPRDRCSTIAAIKAVGIAPAAQTGGAAALYAGGALSEMSGGSVKLCRRRLPIVVSAS
ncbi:hypothetical protein HPB49_014384 [Dermacentor silvarum]|uniref:Uncharacterized protein n=1 Tax=Dermacentor silvarum TaxID=543639 RepID=A0ACB8C491_DERSI|nr:hypothetical protein HPB49_014384 [Dermacentor silvarum]